MRSTTLDFCSKFLLILVKLFPAFIFEFIETAFFSSQFSSWKYGRPLEFCAKLANIFLFHIKVCTALFCLKCWVNLTAFVLFVFFYYFFLFLDIFNVYTVDGSFFYSLLPRSLISYCKNCYWGERQMSIIERQLHWQKRKVGIEY